MSLFFRVDTILQERLREIQLLDLKARKYTFIVNKLIIVHLKNGLSQLPVSWIDCTDVNRSLLYDKEIEDENSLLKYGVMTKIQKGLSEVGSDLDSFNDIEAYALMYSRCQQVMHDHSESNCKETDWRFLKVAESCMLPAKDKQLVAQLKVSCFVPFKIIRLSKAFNYFVLGLGSIFLIYILFILIMNWHNATPIWQFTPSYNFIRITLLVFLVGFLSKFLAKVINVESFIKRKGALFFVLTFGWLFSPMHIQLISPLYNILGKIK